MAVSLPDDERPVGREAAVRLGDLVAAAWGCGRELRRLIAERLTELAIADEEFLALALLEQASAGLYQGELADGLAVSAAQTSGLVERLRRRGWCDSRRDPADRRRQRWVLTPAGQELVARCRVALEGDAVALLFGRSAEEWNSVVGLLVQVSKTAAERIAAGPVASAASSARAVA